MEDCYEQGLRMMTEGLEEWCERKKRHRASLRLMAAMAGVLILSISVSSALIPERDDTFVSGNWSCCTEEACSRVVII